MMNDRSKHFLRWALLVIAVAGSLVAGGCKTDEPENLSMRPWNAPKGWESGMPGGMMDRYR